MRLAIHTEERTYSDRWIEYCRENNINHEAVNGRDSDIINILQDFDGFLDINHYIWY